MLRLGCRLSLEFFNAWVEEIITNKDDLEGIKQDGYNNSRFTDGAALTADTQRKI